MPSALIQAFEWWNKLLERYKIEPGPGRFRPMLSDQVIPVINADRLASELKLGSAAITPAVGWVNFAGTTIVPTGKRWLVYHMGLIPSGTFTAIQFGARRPAAYVGLGEQTPSAYLGQFLPGGLRLRAGESLAAYFDTYTSGSVTLWFAYEEYDHPAVG